MASFKLTSNAVFPNGTTVKAYAATNFPTPIPPSGAPIGSPTAEGTMTSGSVTFTGLTQGTAYWAVAEVGGVYRYVKIRAGEDSANPESAKNAGSLVEVKKEEATEVAAANPQRKTLTLTNDSENLIYFYKGSGATVGKGERLNANGGAVVIDDYNGIVTAAAKTAKSNLTVVEV
jgi:hypothetical protein